MSWGRSRRILFGLACLGVLATSCSSPTLTLVFGGDVSLSRNTGLGVDREGPESLLAEILPLAEGGLLMANFEGVLTDRAGEGAPSGLEPGLVLVAPIRRAQALRGLEGLSLANNHSLDGGESGFEDTRRALLAVGVQPLNGPTIVKKGSWTVGVVAVTDAPPNGSREGRGLAFVDASVAETLRRWRREAPDRPRIVLVHWGQEDSPYPSDRQRLWARSWIDAGADLVVGTHPHVWQPVERRGRGLIAYSIGNLAFDSGGEEARVSGLLRVRWSASRGVEAWEVLPLSLMGPGRRPTLGGQSPLSR